MMPNGYSLSRLQARLCRWAGYLFLFVAALTVADIGFRAIWSGVEIDCSQSGCVREFRPEVLLPEGEQPSLAQDAKARAAFRAYVDRPPIRLALSGIALLGNLPWFVLLLSIGLALRRLAARTGDDLGKALPWLRRASLAALAMVLVIPVAESLTVMLLYPGLPAGPHWYVQVDMVAGAKSLLLAFAAFAVTWAVEAGHRAERDAAEII